MKLRFSVQKHAARRLHYDFRLEHEGVLLSWAIPKGPPSETNEKRLAMQVEDHPVSYIHFEGEIPKGSYGAGTVELWDHGTYEVPGCKTVKESEKAVSEGLKRGHIAITLHGKKLKGDYIFQKFETEQENSWLMIKK